MCVGCRLEAYYIEASGRKRMRINMQALFANSGPQQQQIALLWDTCYFIEMSVYCEYSAELRRQQ